MIAKKNRWQLQEAKARLSELVRQACADGPQVITVRGEEAVVVLSAEEYDRIKPRVPTLLDALLNSPIRDEDAYLFERDKSAGRAVEFP